MSENQILKILERVSTSIKIEYPEHETEFAYNEGIEDMVIQIESLIKNKSDK